MKLSEIDVWSKKNHNFGAHDKLDQFSGKSKPVLFQALVPAIK